MLKTIRKLYLTVSGNLIKHCLYMKSDVLIHTNRPALAVDQPRGRGSKPVRVLTK